MGEICPRPGWGNNEQSPGEAGEEFRTLQNALLVQGVSRHWTPENLAKSQALYKIRHLENIQVSSLCL